MLQATIDPPVFQAATSLPLRFHISMSLTKHVNVCALGAMPKLGKFGVLYVRPSQQLLLDLFGDRQAATDCSTVTNIVSTKS